MTALHDTLPPITLRALERNLRCPGCQASLAFGSDTGQAPGVVLQCSGCEERFNIEAGIPRMLLPEMRRALAAIDATEKGTTEKVRTARSFEFEWSRFSEMRAEWERNFLDYMAPRDAAYFHGKRVLDAGCGSGRHSHYAATYGAEVWAVDLGGAVEVTRRNTQGLPVQVSQADIYHLPFEPESFDFVYSVGVLHHLPDPEAAFRNLLRYVKPGGEILVYLYWAPEGQPLKAALLGTVNALRRVTTRLPYGVLHALSYPAAMAAYASFVWPYRALRRIPALHSLAERIPMKQYDKYPFGVCVNDQFDRFSAPIERRYTRLEVTQWLERAGLQEIEIRPNFGWVGSGRKPLQ